MVEKKSLVSVVIIFLNTEKFIQEAIESVVSQTYENWELLLVDDGSTDNSTKISQKYVEKYPGKIRYLEHNGHQNRGMSASRNLGIHNATGKYIALLDADDIWLPQKLEKQVAILEAQPQTAMVCGPTMYWYSWSNDSKEAGIDWLRELNVQANTLVQPPMLFPIFLQNQGPCTCSLLIRREAIKSIGLFEETFRGQYEDQVFYAKVTTQVPVFVMGECLDWYRQHPTSNCATAEKSGENVSARLLFLNWLELYLSERGFKNTQLWQALQKQLFPYRYPTIYRLKVRIQYFVQQTKRLVKLIVRRTLPFFQWHWN